MTTKSKPKKSKSNETGNIKIESHLKIWDPDTKQVIINQRTE